MPGVLSARKIYVPYITGEKQTKKLVSKWERGVTGRNPSAKSEASASLSGLLTLWQKDNAFSADFLDKSFDCS